MIKTAKEPIGKEFPVVLDGEHGIKIALHSDIDALAWVGYARRDIQEGEEIEYIDGETTKDIVRVGYSMGSVQDLINFGVLSEEDVERFINEK